MQTGQFIVKQLFIDVNVVICAHRLQSSAALLLLSSSFSQLHFSFKLIQLPQDFINETNILLNRLTTRR